MAIKFGQPNADGGLPVISQLPIEGVGMTHAMQDEEKINRVIERFERLKTEKQTWLNVWQVIGELVHLRKMNFTTDLQPGQWLTGRVFDNTAPRACHIAASAMLGALYPNGGRTFKLEPPHDLPDEVVNSKEVKDYYKKAGKRVRHAVDHNKAGFLTSAEEVEYDLFSIGTAGIHTEENDDDDQPVRFIATDAKTAFIDVNAKGDVDTVYTLHDFTVRQVVQEYGYEFVSDNVRRLYDGNGQNEKVRVLRALEPRTDRRGFGVLGMPWATLHIEYDNKHILKESGFHEMPTNMGRFWKTMNEKYGRSPASQAMPDIIEANMLREGIIEADELIRKPPLVVYHDGSLGGAVIDATAGGVSVMNISGRMMTMHQKPIEQLITVGDIKPSNERMIELKQSIEESFFIDRLTDLNKDSRMTAYETSIRNDLRNQSLTMAYSRQIAEIFQPTIERVVNIMYRRGLLGVGMNTPEYFMAKNRGEDPLIIPDAIFKRLQNGGETYRVTFISPATRAMRAEELKGITSTLQLAATVAKDTQDPTIMARFNFDETIHLIADLNNAPEEIVNDDETTAQIKQQMQQAQAAQQQLESAHVQGETARAFGQAAAAGAKAGIPLQALIGGGQQQQDSA